jgi:CDP-diacylglycerol--glycerol-3-phosphate 3-phosphatidyltransferase
LFDGRFRSGVDRVVLPVGRALKRTRLSPDQLTAIGLILAVPTALAIGAGYLGLGLGILIASAVPDLLDGAVAKASQRATARGAFFDSVSDRVTDFLVLGGVAWYLQDRDHGHAFVLPFAVLGVSFLISYERAKAESLGFQAKGGLMERAERIVALCFGLAFSAVLVPILWVMLALSSMTAVQRFVKVWRQASASPADPTDATVSNGPAADAGVAAGPGEDAVQDGTEPADAADREPMPSGAMSARWRAWREANGWPARTDRSMWSSRRSSAGERWRQRRRARLGRDVNPGTDAGPPPRWRSGTRRP